jgi:hypothetical protein
MRRRGPSATYVSIPLQLRYDRHANIVTCRITLTGETLPALCDTANAIIDPDTKKPPTRPKTRRRLFPSVWRPLRGVMQMGTG